MSDVEDSLLELDRAIAADDASAVESVMLALDFVAFEDQGLSDTVLNHILGHLSNDKILQKPWCYALIYWFERHWQALSPGQNDMLMQALTHAYARTAQPMFWFVASELFGVYGSDAKSLAALQECFRKAPLIGKATVCYGLRCMATNSTCSMVRKKAREFLTELSRSTVPEIQREACFELTYLSGS